METTSQQGHSEQKPVQQEYDVQANQSYALDVQMFICECPHKQANLWFNSLFKPEKKTRRHRKCLHMILVQIFALASFVLSFPFFVLVDVPLALSAVSLVSALMLTLFVLSCCQNTYKTHCFAGALKLCVVIVEVFSRLHISRNKDFCKESRAQELRRNARPAAGIQDPDPTNSSKKTKNSSPEPDPKFLNKKDSNISEKKTKIYIFLSIFRCFS